MARPGPRCQLARSVGRLTHRLLLRLCAGMRARPLSPAHEQSSASASAEKRLRGMLVWSILVAVAGAGFRSA